MRLPKILSDHNSKLEDEKEIISKEIARAASNIQERLNLLIPVPVSMPDKKAYTKQKDPKPTQYAKSHAARNAKSDPSPNTGISSLSKCARMILTFLNFNPNHSWNTAQIAMVTQYSRKSSTFKNALASLNTLGLIDKDPGGTVKLHTSNCNERVIES